MTRAMDALVMTRARYRRRYGNDMPESSMPSRFLEEIPAHLLQDLTRGSASHSWGLPRDGMNGNRLRATIATRMRISVRGRRRRPVQAGQTAGSLDNIAQFFSSRKSGGSRPKLEIPVANGATGFRSGQRVRHPKYGEGVVFRREGDGDDAKITVQFAGFGVKKLVEKFAQLEKV